ncbi:RNA-directed DNA polymerase, eukaryota, reverse transcriptase zinc-binding domain protein [Tanacetum coccineum]
MPYVISDHSLALLIFPNEVKRKNKPFKFANYLADKEYFLKTVEDVWKLDVTGFSMFILTKKLKALKHTLNNLNWGFENLVEKVKTLKTSVKDIQTATDADPYNKSLREKECNMLKEYMKDVSDEEKLLFQKSKVKWLNYGDKNNAFFYKVLKGRYHRSRIKSIINYNKQRFNGDQVANQFVNHFKNFSGTSVHVLHIPDGDVLFTKKLSESLGPDGYSAKFFKKGWSIVGKDICNSIMEFFSTGKILGEINATIISLVPKLPTPFKVLDFKPIACCNVVYKCISKILTGRIQGCLDKLINSNQSTIILGRQIQDNILLAQELMKGYERKVGPKRVAFKIDIQKAYDTVNWDFMEGLLRRFEFHPDVLSCWVNLLITKF